MDDVNNPYGPFAANILADIQRELESVSTIFVTTFYSALSLETEAAAVLSRLTPADMDHLRGPLRIRKKSYA